MMMVMLVRMVVMMTVNDYAGEDDEGDYYDGNDDDDDYRGEDDNR